jgi:hypothetical protein
MTRISFCAVALAALATSACQSETVAGETYAARDGGSDENRFGDDVAAEPDATEDANNAEALLTVDEFCAALFDATCQIGSRCGIMTRNIDVCRTDFTRERAGCQSLVDLAHAGRTVYDGVAARAFLRALAETPCTVEPLDEHQDAHRKVFTGSLTEGQNCQDDAECAQGTSCWVGVCQRYRTAGERCFGDAPDSGTPNRPCAAGLRCHNFNGVCTRPSAPGLACSQGEDCADYACLGGLCSGYRGLGQPCTGEPGGGAEWAVCGTGLWCGLDGRCAPLGDVGEPCTHAGTSDTNWPCRRLLTCTEPDRTTNASSCQEPHAH